MSRATSIETAVCETCERLFEEREGARQHWNERRGAILEQGLRGKEIDDELLTLQARFAKANALVSNHLRDCPMCESARGIGHAGGMQVHRQRGAAFRFPLSSFLAFLVQERHH